MRRAAPILLACALLATVPARAQNQNQPTGTGAAGLPAPGGSLATKSLLGLDVVAQDGGALGELEELVIDPAEGLVKFAVVGQGGTLGIGQRSVQVPWHRVRVDLEGGRAMIDMTPDEFALLPEYDSARTEGGNVGAAPIGARPDVPAQQ